MEPIQLLFKNRLQSLQRTKQLCLMQQEGASSGSEGPTLVTAIITMFAECIKCRNQNSLVVPSIAAEQQSHQRMQTWRRSLLIGNLGQEIADVLTSCFATVLILFFSTYQFQNTSHFFYPHPNECFHQDTDRSSNSMLLVPAQV